jgi:hypothetical protein
MRKTWAIVGPGIALLALWFVIAILAWQPMPAEDSDLNDRMINFGFKWNAFVLEYRGCSQHARTNDAGIPMDCQDGSGSFDLKKWNAAKKAAEKLFEIGPGRP